jgi:type II secretory pathway component GspD/PulD (secretin)
MAGNRLRRYALCPSPAVILAAGVLTAIGCMYSVSAGEPQPAPAAPTTPAATTAPADPTAPVLPKEAEAGPATPPAMGPERPKIRRWLDEPAAQPADAATEPVAPGPFVTQPVPEDLPAERKARAAEIKAKLEEAKQAFKLGQYQHVIDIARAVLNADTRNIEAAEWLRKAQGKILDADEVVTNIAGERRDREALLETDQHAVRPPPRLKSVRPHFPRRDEDPVTPRRQKITEKLDQRITVDFSKAELEWVLNTLFILTGVNIIADEAALEGKTLTLHVEEVPLKEVLNFIVRNNEGIQFSVTEDAVWVTASEATDLVKMMYPRVYPLHHGLVSTLEGGGMGAGQRSSGTGRAGGSGGGGRGGGGQRGGGQRGGGQAGGTQELEPSYIETVLKWLKDAKDPQVFPEGSDYLVDRPSNQLIVYTTASGHDRMGEFLNYFDQPPIQVLIKTRFLDISAENEKEFGVNLDSLKTRLGGIDTTGGGGSPTTPATDPLTATARAVEETIRDPKRAFNFAAGTGAISIPGNTGSGNVFTLTGRRTDPQFQATLSMLLGNRHTKVLSEPQILALNNKAAMIDITTHFSYITDLRPVTAYNFAGQGTVTESVPQFVPEFDEDVIGFTLEATPSVGRDLKTINIHLAPVIDSLSEGQAIQQFQSFDASIGGQQGANAVIQRPTIDQTSLETDVVVEDNGYCIIGGLIRNDHFVHERKVPGLHRIPFLGYLFKSKRNDVKRRNMMIIVEAQIVTPGGRTYYKDPDPDDVEPREGGTNRSPGQTSDAMMPNSVSSAVGLPPLPLGPAPTRLSQSPRPGAGPQTRPARPADELPVRNVQPAPVAPKPATAVAEAFQAAADRKTAQTPREQMERMARMARTNPAARQPATGWALAEEEPAGGGATGSAQRAEVVPTQE